MIYIQMQTGHTADGSDKQHINANWENLMGDNNVQT